MEDFLGIGFDECGNMEFVDEEKAVKFGWFLIGTAFVTGYIVAKNCKTVRVNRDLYKHLVKKSETFDKLLRNLGPM